MKVISHEVVMIGAFPPPVNGMATVNAAVYEHLKQAGANPLVIDLAADSLDRSLTVRLCRIPKVFTGLIRLLFDREVRKKRFYMSLSGGNGQGFEILFLLIARVRKMGICLHHHSFSYLIRRSWLTEFLLNVAGPFTTHVTLCPEMASCLRKTYPVVRRVFPVSNAALLSNNAPKPKRYRSRLQTVGFFGNISAAKGVFDFLNLIEAIMKEKIGVKAKLAGPFQDVETEHEVRRRLAQQGATEYVGPKYGIEKETFLSTIDVLIFPTRYVNEAEPLTIHEAMSCGVPVITIGLGCIPEIVGSESGKVIDPVEPFGPAALMQVKEWVAFPQTFETVSRSAANRFSETVSDNMHRLAGILAEITGDQ